MELFEGLLLLCAWKTMMRRREGKANHYVSKQSKNCIYVFFIIILLACVYMQYSSGTLEIPNLKQIV